MQVLGDGDNQERRELEERVLTAQADESSGQREALLGEYQSYIIRIASRICKRSITLQDDEYTIALAGFNEAITQYRRSEPSSFLTFAYMVIQRRLTDYYRREQKHQNQVPLIPPDARENESVHKEVVAESFEQFRERELAEIRRSEIEQFTQALARFGIKLTDLVKASPKHRDTRENMLSIALEIAANQQWMEEFLHQKKIKKSFAEQIGCHRRTLKRHRIYLTALVLVLVEDLPLMRDYLGLPIDRKGGGIRAEGDGNGSQSAALCGADS
ncbi:RNA polymerase sigma-I factor [Desmospora activa]|uniref:RNA polymerase sigma-I factor n=1 Tax=Desmospora activa TaxID=500615 RepID=UPI001472B1AF|nr:RNA polymerase sigma-I factor [Desmospora activa]